MLSAKIDQHLHLAEIMDINYEETFSLPSALTFHELFSASAMTPVNTPVTVAIVSAKLHCGIIKTTHITLFKHAHHSLPFHQLGMCLLVLNT